MGITGVSLVPTSCVQNRSRLPVVGSPCATQGLIILCQRPQEYPCHKKKKSKNIKMLRNCISLITLKIKSCKIRPDPNPHHRRAYF